MAPVPAPTDDVLRRMTLFRRLAPEDRARVTAVARLRHYHRGERLFDEGEEAGAFLAIVDGRVKVYKATPSGKEVILEIFGPGDPLAAVAVYEHHPVLVRGLLSGLTLRLAELTRRLAELTGAKVEARFARLFLKLARQIGRVDRGGVFVPMALTRQELADLTGTTSETAIRIMSRWQKDAVLLTEREGFTLVDRDALEDIAAS